MSDSSEPMTVSDDVPSPAGETPPVDLPPVEPPSAGFIIQLFVVPGLIVLAVVGVWALFGQLAAGEQDWQALIVELSNSNEHRRWRGAHGLAQMLQAEQEQDSSDDKLTQNPVIITRLTELFERELARTAPSESDIQFQAFLARTMGLLEANKKVLPLLRDGMQEKHDREVRKNSVAAVALIASRSRTAGESFGEQGVIADLVDVSSDSDPLMRQVAAYTLGLMSSDAADERLTVLLDDADRNTQLNAAIAFARNSSAAGARVLESVLSESTEKFEPVGIEGLNPVEQTKETNNQLYQRDARLVNTLKAIESIAEQLSAAQRESIGTQLDQVAESQQIKSAFRNRAKSVRKQLAKLD